MSIISLLIPSFGLIVLEPSPCLRREEAYGYAMHLRHLLELTEPHERKAWALEAAVPDSVALVQDDELCKRGRDAYNARRTHPWQPPIAVVGVYWVGTTRIVVVGGDDPGEHHRDWMVYDSAFEALGGFVN